MKPTKRPNLFSAIPLSSVSPLSFFSLHFSPS